MNSPLESSPLAGLVVAIFESRMAGATADLIARHGGIPLAAPALREVPLGENHEVTIFAHKLMGDELDVVIFETGVGVRYLAQAIEPGCRARPGSKPRAGPGRRARTQAGRRAT